MLQPILQIRQTPAVIGIDADLGAFSITQPKAEVNISTTAGKWDIQTFKPELSIDQSRAWAAYNGGNMLEMNKRIYSGIQQLYLQGIARKVEQGNQMAEFLNLVTQLLKCMVLILNPIRFLKCVVRHPLTMSMCV